MADNWKEQEWVELHHTIWNIANNLHGSVDEWDFKQYVLRVLFYRYTSENLASYINESERESRDGSFSYAGLSNNEVEMVRQDLVETKGFFTLPNPLFENIRKKIYDDENLNETFESVFHAIEASAQVNKYNKKPVKFLNDMDYIKIDKVIAEIEKGVDV